MKLSSDIIHKKALGNNMVIKAIATIVAVFVCIPLFQSNTCWGQSEPSEKDLQAYQQELARIRAAEEALTPGPTNDLAKYETFVDEIEQKWKKRDKECFARLMETVCKPLSSGSFKDVRRYELARKYALSALENRDAIPLLLECQLIGHVATPLFGPDASKEEVFSERRKKDVEVRLHAWKRLTDAIDPNWDPDDLPVSNVLPPTATGLPGGVAPEAIKDEKLRAEYEAAIQRNRQKTKRYAEQRELRLLLKTFPKNVEDYIVQAYSHPPYDVKELKKSLNKYKIDRRTKTRILNAVKKNSDKAKS